MADERNELCCVGRGYRVQPASGAERDSRICLLVCMKNNFKRVFLVKFSLGCKLLPHRIALLLLKENVTMIF